MALLLCIDPLSQLMPEDQHRSEKTMPGGQDVSYEAHEKRRCAFKLAPSGISSLDPANLISLTSFLQRFAASRRQL